MNTLLPVMVYGSETWTLKMTHVELIMSVAQCKMERIMFGITLCDHKRNTWIQHQIGVNDIEITLCATWVLRGQESQRPTSVETV